MVEMVTIKVAVQTKKMLDEMKIHHRETYDDVIIALIAYEDDLGDDDGNK